MLHRGLAWLLNSLVRTWETITRDMKWDKIQWSQMNWQRSSSKGKYLFSPGTTCLLKVMLQTSFGNNYHLSCIFGFATCYKTISIAISNQIEKLSVIFLNQNILVLMSALIWHVNTLLSNVIIAIILLLLIFVFCNFNLAINYDYKFAFFGYSADKLLRSSEVM